jgi:NAD(P)-dependent dehydrogenase (short-subunit alcohol dehydrogenase family)
MKNVIVVTGASSGFGLLTARAWAQDGRVVYATMRNASGRDGPRVMALSRRRANRLREPRRSRASFGRGLGQDGDASRLEWTVRAWNREPSDRVDGGRSK